MSDHPSRTPRFTPRLCFYACIHGCVAALCFVVLLSRHARAADLVKVDTSRVVVDSFMGMGIQWDPYEYPPTPADWKLTLDRLDYCRPAFFRVMANANYCTGFDKDGNPHYVWDNGEARAKQSLGQVFSILDYCQARGISVMLGEWSWPRFLKSEDGTSVSGPDDPRWARIIADYAAYLHDVHHYTCIRWYNMFNEPNGSWMWKVNYPAWVTGIRNLRKALDAKGIKWLTIVGPDNSGSWEWLDRSARDLSAEIGGWEMHWYAYDHEVLNGDIEALLSGKRDMLARVDPKGASKVRFMGESGIMEGRMNGDQQPRVKTFVYGVLMADYAAQVARAGWGGLSAWDLDDALHTVTEKKHPPDDKTLKVWGFWNTQGRAMGHPEDENIRPWFYTWSLMSRLFPSGCRIVHTTQPQAHDFRAVAMKQPNGAKWDLSFMIVNEQDTPRTETLVVPNAVGSTALKQYNYFDDDRPVGANGFPIPKKTLDQADLKAGIAVSLPSRGVVFLTTLDGGAPLPLVEPKVDTIIDELSDWSEIFSHSANLVFDASNPDYFDGDITRLKRMTLTPEEVVYKQPGLTEFEATTYAEGEDPKAQFSFFTSGDGVTWSPVAPKVADAGKGGWRRIVYTLEDLAGVGYIKIRWMPVTGNVWSPQLTQVKLVTRG